MTSISRRDFVAGLSVLGVAGLVLRVDAQPTPQAGEAGEYASYLHDRQAVPTAAPTGQWKPTEDCILGPFYRKGAPFRAKVTPPLEFGVVLLVRGRVWAHDTRRPLAGAVLDVWQANAVGRYDNDDPRNPPQKDVFCNRTRCVTDEAGFYEFETIHPGAYKTGPDTWRPSHIHYAVSHPGYKVLITQLFFQGDPHNKTDQFIKESLIVNLRTVKVGTQSYESGVFDIVLAPEQR